MKTSSCLQMIRKYIVISEEEGCIKLQVDVDNVIDWFIRWQMKVIMNKCCILHVGGRHHLHKYQLSDLDGAKYEIPVYDSFTDLGIILNSDLKFKESFHRSRKQMQKSLE